MPARAPIPLSITFDQDLATAPAMHLTVRAGGIRMEIEVPDARQPVKLDPEEAELMRALFAKLREAGAPLGMLTGIYGGYFLYCLAQHVKMAAEGETFELAGLTLSRALPTPKPALPRFTAIVIS